MNYLALNPYNEKGNSVIEMAVIDFKPEQEENLRGLKESLAEVGGVLLPYDEEAERLERLLEAILTDGWKRQI